MVEEEKQKEKLRQKGTSKFEFTLLTLQSYVPFCKIKWLKNRHLIKTL